MKEQTLWVTRTGILLALLVVFQAAANSLGSTLVTGSVVNLLLILSVLLAGLPSGLVIACVSPVLAKLLGIGPLWSLIPFIIAGNVALALVWHCIGKKRERSGRGRQKMVLTLTAVAAGAGVKFFVLYLGIVKLAVPVLMRLPEKQAEGISAMFSFPQLITALIGGALAALLAGPLKRSLRRWSSNS